MFHSSNIERLSEGLAVLYCSAAKLVVAPHMPGVQLRLCGRGRVQLRVHSVQAGLGRCENPIVESEFGITSAKRFAEAPTQAPARL